MVQAAPVHGVERELSFESTSADGSFLPLAKSGFGSGTDDILQSQDRDKSLLGCLQRVQQKTVVVIIIDESSFFSFAPPAPQLVQIRQDLYDNIID
ncbi:hypothetical protein CVT26_013173 [Gymnopilus dilepis]|uniref:Uncharacterized protein n=1 Tax=Gymnopilus dilepis TaxID=231916 RepID=A0A409YFP4_9AGAR|nr:hypothetical protein CVT26_013173 [Gymnopilus dilepis]